MWQTSTGPRPLTLPERQLFASAIDFYLLDRGMRISRIDRELLPVCLPGCLATLTDPQLYFCLDAAVADLCSDRPPPEPAAWRDAVVWTLCELIGNCVIVDQDRRQDGRRDVDVDEPRDDVTFRQVMSMSANAYINDAKLILFRNRFVKPPYRWKRRSDGTAYFAPPVTFPALQQLRQVLE